MATAHRRIGVTKDQDLAAALDATRPLLGSDGASSEAGHVRRLALIGARALRDQTFPARAELDRQRIRERPGVRRASRALEDLPWLDGDTVDEEERASRALEWVRGGP